MYLTNFFFLSFRGALHFYITFSSSESTWSHKIQKSSDRSWILDFSFLHEESIWSNCWCSVLLSTISLTDVQYMWDIDFSIEAIIANVYIFPPFQMQILVLAKISFLHKYSNENSHSTVYSLNAKRLRTYISIVVCLLSGRPPKGEVGIPWPQRLEFSLTSEGLAFSNALFPGQAWGTNLVLLPYAGGQA